MNSVATVNLLNKYINCFENKNEYYQIIDGMKKKNKIDIINSIETFRKYKRFFVNKEEYFQIMNWMYMELSNNNSIQSTNLLKPDTKINLIMKEEVIEKEKNDMIETVKKYVISNKMELIELFDFLLIYQDPIFILNMLKMNNIEKINSLFEILYDLNNLGEINHEKKYNLQTDPIKLEYDKNLIVKKVKFLLHLCEIVVGFKNKAAVSLIIYDELFKNYCFVSDHLNFKNTLKAKINEFIKKDKEKINEIIIAYDLDKEILEKWYAHLEK